MRKSHFLIALLACQLVLLAFISAHAVFSERAGRTAQGESAALVRTLSLTDLCLFSEASYTRHLSQADLHAPFQDHPFSLEHFPSGALAPPPPVLGKINGHY